VLTIAQVQAEKERERENRGRVTRDSTFNGEGEEKHFSAVKVPRQCPLVLLVKVD
jgi:hypothetical protein